MSDKQPTARARLRTWIRKEINGKSEVRLPALTTKAVAWVKKDKALLNAVLAELLKPLIYEEARLLTAESRQAPKGVADALVQLGDEVVSRGVLKGRAKSLARFWNGMREHAGDRHILVMDMTDHDLTLAEDERRKRGDTEHEWADVWVRLRTRLEPGQRVRDAWTVEEIEAVRQSIRNTKAA